MGDEPQKHSSSKETHADQSLETVTDNLSKGIERNGEKREKSSTEKADTAAVQVQRLYRGYRTRRNIADAAVMAQKFGWWNVVDGAMLQHHSSQFYAYKEPQNAAQRWVRLKVKAAKVGKGLSRNDQARKLALQHWLEAIDPRHRYGHNLHFYYEEWCKSNTQEPFFYWLDVGEGNHIDLPKCKRSKLQSEQISYLSPKERKWFQVLIEEGKLVYKMTEKPVDTPKGEKWIFVMGTNGNLYVGKKEKGKLQHSSFLAGGVTIAAGRLVVKKGTIELMEAHSGHYHPTPDNFKQLISILTSSGADLTMAKVQFVSDDMHLDSLSSKSLPGENLLIENDIPEDEMVVTVDETIVNTVTPTKVSHTKETVVNVTRSEPEKDMRDIKGSGLDMLKGFRLEIMQPTRTPESVQDEKEVENATQSACDRYPEPSSPNFVENKHKLFGPAMRTFSRLDIDYCTRAVREIDLQKSSGLNPNTKQHLIRRLSMSRRPLTIIPS